MQFTVFALGWILTAAQQEYLLKPENSNNILNEPSVEYIPSINRWIDEDYENGETDISIFCQLVWKLLIDYNAWIELKHYAANIRFIFKF